MNLYGKVLSTTVLVLVLASCSSMKMPSIELPSMPSLPSFSSGKPEGSPVYEVMVQGAPFYKDRSPEGLGGGSAHPYLYLPKGTTVNLQKVGKRYSQVSLVNGMVGWMSSTELAPQSTVTEMAPADAPSAQQGADPPAGANSSPGPVPNPDRGIQLPAY